MKKKKSLMGLLLLMAIGFAAVSTTLYLNGTVNIKSNLEDYDVYYSNAKVNGEEDKSVIVDDTHIEFTEEFKSVGETYTLEYDITNGSKNYDADVVMSCTAGNDYIRVTNSWVDHTVINSTETKSGTLKAEVIKSYTGNDKLELNVICEITASAQERTIQGTGTPADKVEQGVAQVSFADDSWETIQKAVQSSDYIYQVGDTKTVDMGVLGTHTVRVANTTECTNGETSETACGFVVEFADIITTHNMNSSSTNVGGWRDSAMRTYVNNDIYDALPSDLQSVIANTTVVSGHGYTSGETNFTTTDKLYLLNAQEVWGTNERDTSVGTSRQLDYYKNLGVTASNYAGAIKQYNGSNSSWWLRSAESYYDHSFLYVYVDGEWNFISASAPNPCGVSAAFRIA